jgi:hypothetical protein
MSATFELRYWDEKLLAESKSAPSFKRNCEPAQLVTEARKIFKSCNTPVIEAWLYDHYMFAIDRSAIESNLIGA